MFLFDDSKRLEKALGEEATSVIVHAFEKMSEENRRELATKADLDLRLAETEARFTAEIAKARAEATAESARSRAEIIKWTAGLLIAQAVLIAAMAKLV